MYNSICITTTHITLTLHLKEEMIMTKNVLQLKEKLNKYRYGDRPTTTRSIQEAFHRHPNNTFTAPGHHTPTLECL